MPLGKIEQNLFYSFLFSQKGTVFLTLSKREIQTKDSNRLQIQTLLVNKINRELQK